MNVLLDTDVVLDLVLARDPFVVDAAAIWPANEQGRCVAFISPITPVNVFYIARRSRGADAARQAVRDLLVGLRIAPLSQADLRSAEALPFHAP
jgi:predicted nucleic acid-binding protein